MNRRNIILALVATVTGSAAEPSEWVHAHELYQQTNYVQSLAVLSSLNTKDPAVLQLTGQDYFMLAEYKKASEYLEKAAALDPNKADCLMWLARAHGPPAATSNPFSAPGQSST